MTSIFARQRITLIVMSLCLLSTGMPRAAQQQDGSGNLFGTWELLVGESVFIDREIPKSQTRIYTPHKQGVQARIVTVDQHNIRSEVGYTASEDGVAHPTYGTAGADEIILHPTGPNTATAIFTHAGREVGDAIREIYPDGERMVVTVTLNGNLVSRSIYQKQTD